jgi:hypothetical protein
MSQDWTDDVYASAHTGETDLQNMENNFAALKSLFMGASAPGSMAAGHPWLDSTQHVFKYRNDGDSAWVGLMHGDTSQKFWVYRNAAMDGWAVDSSVSDNVLSLKGGTTYTAGAVTAGSWTISGITSDTKADHTHGVSGNTSTDGVSPIYLYENEVGAVSLSQRSHYHSFSVTSGGGGGHSHVISHDGTWRPAAAVGTLQYLDL